MTFLSLTWWRQMSGKTMIIMSVAIVAMSSFSVGRHFDMNLLGTDFAPLVTLIMGIGGVRMGIEKMMKSA
jgi:hypothetical protein